MEFINLNKAVLNALDYFSNVNVPKINNSLFSKPLVVGSGNAYAAGKILFDDINAVFADESNFLDVLNKTNDIDGVYLISSSGAKHAPGVANEIKKRKLKLVLITNNEHSLTKDFVDSEIIFPCLSEPYTYNVSSYLGMILSKNGDRASTIKEFVMDFSKNIPSDLGKYDSFCFLLPNKFLPLKEMFLTKFDELFGSKISCRIFTFEQAKHAKTIVRSDTELFCGFGVNNKIFGSKRVNFSLPKNSDYASVMSLVYYFIGCIQEKNRPYFKEGLDSYIKETSKMFGQKTKDFVN